MVLSRIQLNPARRETLRALGNAGILHGAVEACFPGEDQRMRRLWRVDELRGATWLLVVSDVPPDFTPIARQFGIPGDRGESRDYDLLLNRLQAGQVWHFRLRANPVKSLPTPGARGHVVAHVTPEQQKQWLLSRAANCGFSLEEETFSVVQTQWERFARHAADRETVSLRTALFEGLLTVTDVPALRLALCQGIGRAKAYGCGLLTLVRP